MKPVDLLRGIRIPARSSTRCFQLHPHHIHVHPVALYLSRLRISNGKVQDVDVGDYVDRVVLGFWDHMDRLFEHNVSGFIQNDSDFYLVQPHYILIGLGFTTGPLLRIFQEIPSWTRGKANTQELPEEAQRGSSKNTVQRGMSSRN